MYKVVMHVVLFLILDLSL